MYIRRLRISGLRNIATADLQPSPTFNAITGPNGSGKTSLLEAIYLVSRGQSFRTRKIDRVIAESGETLVVRADLCDTSGREHSNAVQRTRGERRPEMRVDGREAASTAALAENLPVLLLHSASQELVSGGPALRRQFVDWGVFHVEHEFIEQWRRFRRALEQRNALLRHGRMTPAQHQPWETMLAESAEIIDTYRKGYLEQLRPLFGEVLSQLQPELAAVSIGYHRGWDARSDLYSQLEAHRERDLRYRATSEGPHRADVPLVWEGEPAAERLSRGQAKLVVYALKLAQGMLLRQQAGRTSVYLLDDLPAELDSQHRQRVLELLEPLQAQVFVTGVEPDGLAPQSADAQLFHVEQGRFADCKIERR